MRNIFTPFFLLILFSANAQDGTLDLSFGTSGKVVTSPTPAVYRDRQKITVLTSGKILQCYTSAGTTNDFALVRYNSDGSVDGTFGTSGYVITDFGANEVATSLAVQSDGKIIVAGFKTSNTSTSDGVFALARYSSSGVLDAGFGTGGKVTTALGNDDAAYSVLEAGGIIVAGGYSRNTVTGFYQFAIACYQSNGSLYTGFSGDGKQTTTIGIVDAVAAIGFQGDGKLVAAGYSSPDASSYEFALVRYNTDGSLDGGFGTGGIVETVIGTGGNDIAYALALEQSLNGKIIAAGTSNNGTTQDFAVARYNSDGSLDAGFGTGGSVTTDINGDENAYAVALQSDGKIIAAGDTRTGFGNPYDFAIARYDQTGSLDVNFGGNMTGINTIDFGPGGDDVGYDIASQGAGIIFGGTSGNNLALARLQNTSTILPVNLLAFTASTENTAVRLNWQTISEQNSLFFEVLRSTDGNNFTKIGQVAASGNSTEMKKYSFVDVKPFAGVNFYRLRIVNYDNSFSYSKILVVRTDSKSNFEIFPNPVSDVLNLRFIQPPGTIRLQLADVSGRIVKQFEFHSTGTAVSAPVYVGDLQKGIYFIRLNDQTIKIIKGN